MTEQELRALVRQAIARAGTGRASAGPAAGPAHPAISLAHHTSHAMFVLPDGADADGPCIIEPAVACNHCGYCKSMGH